MSVLTRSEPVAEKRNPLEVIADYPSIRESTYFAEYVGRLGNNRDMHTIVTAEGETGVGKSTLAASICLLLDLYGWTAEKATLDPREYASKYDEHAPGSWLLGDEWEQAMDRRLSTSRANRELSHNYASKRYRQIFSCVTLPSRNWLDKRLSQSSADYWIQCLEGKNGRPKGQARVYRLREEEHYQTSLTKKTETITWPVLDSHPEMQKVHRLKQERLEGVDQSKYVHRDEFEEAKKNFWEKATKKTRYGMVKGMYEFGLKQSDIAEITSISQHVEGIGQRQVSNLVNTESFEDAYQS